MITHIDYFHCDTQGNDLKALKSMGVYLGIIKRGCIEAARNKEVALYKNQHTLLEAYDYLTEHGFVVTLIDLNDAYNNEINVYFENTKNLHDEDKLHLMNKGITRDILLAFSEEPPAIPSEPPVRSAA